MDCLTPVFKDLFLFMKEKKVRVQNSEIRRFSIFSRRGILKLVISLQRDVQKSSDNWSSFFPMGDYRSLPSPPFLRKKKQKFAKKKFLICIFEGCKKVQMQLLRSDLVILGCQYFQGNGKSG